MVGALVTAEAMMQTVGDGRGLDSLIFHFDISYKNRHLPEQRRSWRGSASRLTHSWAMSLYVIYRINQHLDNEI